jgi:hypothetical protein
MRYIQLPLALLILFVACLAIGQHSFGQAAPAEAPPPPPKFECRWADGPIVIDGTADEPAWARAQVIDDFRAWWLPGSPPAKAGTRARLLWDAEYLYFFAEMDDVDIFADVTEHDGPTWLNDVFELFFRPDDEHPGYYEFHVNAANTIFDCYYPKRDLRTVLIQKDIGEFGIETKVQLRGTLNERDDVDEGWSVEGRIPWRDFQPTGGRPEAGQIWRFALCRYDFVKGQTRELSTIAPIRQRRIGSFFHQYEDYAVLKFVAPD